MEGITERLKEKKQGKAKADDAERLTNIASVFEIIHCIWNEKPWANMILKKKRHIKWAIKRSGHEFYLSYHYGSSID